MRRAAWDVVVIGAGPAGAMAALASARSGASVLLVDKRRFPRTKPCGCCINGAALAVLAGAGVTLPVGEQGLRRLERLQVAWGRRGAAIPLPAGVVLSRSALDAALVDAAVGAGAVFVDGVSASAGPADRVGRNVSLGGERTGARSVVVATGLGATIDDEAVRYESVGRAGSRMGVAAVVDGAGCDYGGGAVYMACGPMGYVGLVRLEDNRLNIAGALDPAYVRAMGGPGPAAAAVMMSCGMRVPERLGVAEWRGTPLLRRSRAAVAGERLFVVGDAAGYVEPFTGEGIAWALAGGLSVGRLAAQPWRPELGREWARSVRRLRRRQVVCRGVTACLRRPWAARLMIGACAAATGLTGPVVRAINRPIPMDRGAAAIVA